MDIKQKYREETNLDVYPRGILGVGASFSNEYVKWLEEQLRIGGVGSSLPDLAECNQASLDYAAKKNNPDFFLIKQTFKDGVNWALNYMTKQK